MDTVRIAISCSKKLTTENSSFTMYSVNENGIRVLRIPESAYLFSEEDLYHPKIWYMERPDKKQHRLAREIMVEFSVPKLLFGNNIREIEEADFEFMVAALLEHFEFLGLNWVTEEDIKNALVRRLDVGKNVVLDGRISAGNVVRDLRVIDLDRHYEKYERTFVGGGEMVEWHSKQEDIIFYDKTAEANKKKAGRGIVSEDKSVLRFEVQLSGKPVIDRRMKKAKLPPIRAEDFTFENLFKEQIWRGLVSERVDYIFKKLPGLTIDDDAWQFFLKEVAAESGKKGGLTRVLARFGYAMATELSPSMTIFNSVIDDAFGQDARYALRKKPRFQPRSPCDLRALLAVKDEIKTYCPLTPADLYDFGLNC